ncbi:MAG: S41 family peptidase [Desulfuromusa sp.]|jgi:carboxyl-terminal processing protease|nr:S41 family peptidase [Desulfuromusa sp.]
MPKLKQSFLGGVFLLIFCCSAAVFCDTASANDKDEYQNLEIFTDVLSLIRSSYVEKVDMEELIYGAIRGMLSTLDPHSSFLTPEMYEEMQAETHGEFGGLGIEITIKDGNLIIVSPIEDTPADAVGLQAGDQIIKINGKPTRDIEIMEAVRMMRGPKGEAITISIQRSGVTDLLDFTIVRDLIQVQSVKSRLLQSHYGYVRVSQFQDRTGTDLKESLMRLRQESGEQFQGMILDLRNNPGGLLDQAVEVADLFLSQGLIVYTEGREPEAQMKFSARQDGTEPEYPLVVLINGGSASAAEIVAGALQDHSRAIILGEQSFGKGSVQTIIPLDDNSGLRLTTARYFTPSGRSIQARGISPDIAVSQLKFQRLENEGPPLREEDLENHFQPSTQQQSGENHNILKESVSEEQEDTQLQRAIDLLKGINILKQYSKAA